MTNAERWCLKRRESSEDLESIRATLSQQAGSFVDLDPDVLRDPVLAKVLYARKIAPSQIPSHLARSSPQGDPFSMAGMADAVARLRQALRGEEAIVVYGDFDVDGVTATVLLVSALKLLGARVSVYIPDRFSEAYGLNKPALQRLHRQGARLVVTVDCGVRSVDEIRYAQALGMDTIVTDHHSIPQELPPARAVINPKRPDCAYPFKDLSGVGVVYRLVEALFRVSSRMDNWTEGNLESFLDLVALGTVADIVPLVDENRRIVSQGLELMHKSPRPGIAALIECAGVRRGRVSSEDIAFRLAPRLNAAGRLKSALLAYDLLSTTDDAQTVAAAEELNALNQQRQALLEKQVAEACDLLGAQEAQQVLVVEGPQFHEGIVGLVASRLVEEYYRPALVMRRGRETMRGSARSIEGFHITRALDACAHLLLRYGGHERAAGFSLPVANLDAFRQHLQAYGASCIDTALLCPRYSVDAIVSLDEVSEKTPPALDLLEPFGEGNPAPALATLGTRIVSMRAVGEEGKHLQFQVTDGQRYVGAIAFRQGFRVHQFAVGQTVDLIYRPMLNAWQGQVSLQLVVDTMRPSNSAVVV